MKNLLVCDDACTKYIKEWLAAWSGLRQWANNKESSQPVSGCTLQTLNDFPCRYIFIRQRWCSFKGVTIVKHIKGRVWIGCFGSANSIKTWIYQHNCVYLLCTNIKLWCASKKPKKCTRFHNSSSARICQGMQRTIGDPERLAVLDVFMS